MHPRIVLRLGVSLHFCVQLLSDESRICSHARAAGLFVLQGWLSGILLCKRSCGVLIATGAIT